MKRSKMIIKLCEKYDFEVFEASDILNFLEKEGMLPPDSRCNALQLTTDEWRIKRQQWVQDTYKWEE